MSRSFSGGKIILGRGNSIYDKLWHHESTQHVACLRNMAGPSRFDSVVRVSVLELKGLGFDCNQGHVP